MAIMDNTGTLVPYTTYTTGSYNAYTNAINDPGHQYGLAGAIAGSGGIAQSAAGVSVNTFGPAYMPPNFGQVVYNGTTTNPYAVIGQPVLSGQYTPTGQWVFVQPGQTWSPGYENMTIPVNQPPDRSQFSEEEISQAEQIMEELSHA